MYLATFYKATFYKVAPNFKRLYPLNEVLLVIPFFKRYNFFKSICIYIYVTVKLSTTNQKISKGVKNR